MNACIPGHDAADNRCPALLMGGLPEEMDGQVRGRQQAALYLKAAAAAHSAASRELLRRRAVHLLSPVLGDRRAQAVC